MIHAIISGTEPSDNVSPTPPPKKQTEIEIENAFIYRTTLESRDGTDGSWSEICRDQKSIGGRDGVKGKEIEGAK